MRKVGRSVRQGAGAGRRRGFTLVEMLVVITIIALIMALVGPRVLNYLGESKAKAAKIQIESFSSALDLYYLDPAAIRTARRPDRAGARQQRARLERALSEGRRGAARSLGPSLCLSLAGRARALRNHFLGSDGRKAAVERQPTSPAARAETAAASDGFHADRNGLRARASSRMLAAIVLPALPRGTSRARLESLCGRDRRAAEGRPQRRDPPPHRRSRPQIDAPCAIDALRRRPAASSACRTMCASMRCWRRAAPTAVPGRPSTSFASGMSCGGTIALTRLGHGLSRCASTG